MGQSSPPAPGTGIDPNKLAGEAEEPASIVTPAPRPVYRTHTLDGAHVSNIRQAIAPYTGRFGCSGLFISAGHRGAAEGTRVALVLTTDGRLFVISGAPKHGGACDPCGPNRVEQKGATHARRVNHPQADIQTQEATRLIQH